MIIVRERERLYTAAYREQSKLMGVLPEVGWNEVELPGYVDSLPGIVKCAVVRKRPGIIYGLDREGNIFQSTIGGDPDTVINLFHGLMRNHPNKMKTLTQGRILRVKGKNEVPEAEIVIPSYKNGRPDHLFLKPNELQIWMGIGLALEAD